MEILDEHAGIERMDMAAACTSACMHTGVDPPEEVEVKGFEVVRREECGRYTSA
jgi:hypothetical protein